MSAIFIRMAAINIPKKQSRAAAEDWHNADIVASLHKAGWSLRSLSRHNGYHPQSLNLALQRRWPKAQKIIADAIGVSPQKIWPSRYRSSNGRKYSPGKAHGS